MIKRSCTFWSAVGDEGKCIFGIDKFFEFLDLEFLDSGEVES